MKTRSALLLAVIGVVSWAAHVGAADQWIEVRSPHFTVVSNASEGATRTLVWQLEQVRSVMTSLWSWARVDLNKPMCVIAVKDENAMRLLAPGYWRDIAMAEGQKAAADWVHAVRPSAWRMYLSRARPRRRSGTLSTPTPSAALRATSHVSVYRNRSRAGPTCSGAAR